VIKTASTYVLGTAMTFATFYGMQALVAQEPQYVEPKLTPFPEIPVYEDTIDKPMPPEWDIDKPEPIIPPKPDPIDRMLDDRDVGPNIGITPPEGPVEPEPTQWLGSQDGEMVAIITVSPNYPRRCVEKGAEGTVDVSLTVASDGQVEPNSVVVLASSDSCFDKAAIKAASKFKYRPKIVNGIAEPVHNVMYRFTFEIEN